MTRRWHMRAPSKMVRLLPSPLTLVFLPAFVTQISSSLIIVLINNDLLPFLTLSLAGTSESHHLHLNCLTFLLLPASLQVSPSLASRFLLDVNAARTYLLGPSACRPRTKNFL